jgi:hypothetical protein
MAKLRLLIYQPAWPVKGPVTHLLADVAPAAVEPVLQPDGVDVETYLLEIHLVAHLGQPVRHETLFTTAERAFGAEVD